MAILKPYFTDLLTKDKREDGRKLFEYRDVVIETGAIERANGSARVKIGNTEVLVGVKLDVGTPFPDSPESGILMVNAELLPLASPHFEFGPPSKDAVELARVIDRGIRESHAVDLDKLCIKQKEKVWMVFVDIYPINDDGNLFDAGALGAIAALKTAILPKYDEDEEKVLHKELTKTKLPIQQIPILTTFAKLNGKIFVDTTMREEKEIDARLSIATIDDETTSAMQKGGVGTFTAKEILELTEKAAELAKKLRKLIPSK